jgi:hypothetical protein
VPTWNGRASGIGRSASRSPAWTSCAAGLLVRQKGSTQHEPRPQRRQSSRPFRYHQQNADIPSEYQQSAQQMGRAGFVQAALQDPQCAGSWVKSVHTAPEPARQMTCAAGQEHTPSVQVPPAGHEMPHPPQFARSVVLSTHLPSQKLNLAGQEQIPLVQKPSDAHATWDPATTAALRTISSPPRYGNALSIEGTAVRLGVSPRGIGLHVKLRAPIVLVRASRQLGRLSPAILR